jgi:serine phosphatase RsbU (regulator of sigma subunit)
MTSTRSWQPRLSLSSIAVLVLGAAITAVLTVGADVSYGHTEKRLTQIESKLTASALGIAPATLERELGNVVTAAAASSDPVKTYVRLMRPLMSPTGDFASSTLAVVRDAKTTLLDHLGSPTITNLNTPAALKGFAKVARTTKLVTSRAVGKGRQRLIYSMSSPGTNGIYVVGAGQELPVDRFITIPKSSPLAGFDVALYFGKTTHNSALIEATTHHLPLKGTVATSSVAFGTSSLTISISSRRPLTGSLADALPWVVLGSGLFLTVLATVLVERLDRQRREAERLTADVERLYIDQRSISLNLQQSLLPRAMPFIPGFEFAARYIAGTRGMDVGGDWYSVIGRGDGGFAFVVGDVSGRGVQAAAVMASLRYSVRTMAALGYGPEAILQMTASELNLPFDGHFATALVGVVDENGLVTVASAGHLPPLVLGGGQARFLSIPVGLPLGIREATYVSTTVQLNSGDSLLAFTDGLIERRGQSLDVGLENLRQFVAGVDAPLSDLLGRVVGHLIDGESDDDTALLGIRCVFSGDQSTPEPAASSSTPA